MTISIPLEDNYEATLTQKLADSGSALTIYVSRTPVATIPASKELVMTINPKKGFNRQENVLIESYNSVAKTLTVKSGGRAQSRYNGDSPTALEHSVGSKIIISDAYPVWNVLDDYLSTTGGTMTGAINFNDASTYINEVASDLVFKSDVQAVVTLTELANAAGVNDKAKVSVADTTSGYLNDKITAGDGLSKSITNPAGNEVLDLDIDLTDSTIFSATGVAGKVPLYDGSGNLPAGNKLVTSGTANTTTTDQYALSYNGNTKLDLADGNQAALNQEWLLAGIANGASTDGNAQSYYPFGPIVTVPAFTLSQRQSCRLWDGQSNTTSNTTTDTVSTTIEWRAQTFTPTTGQDNVSAFVLNFTKTSSPNGSSTVALYATSGGLPTGAALATCTTILNSAITTGDNTFSLATPYAVTPGTVYAIVWSSGISAGGNLAWNYQNTDVYATGQRCTSANSGTNWTAAATNDMRFTVKYRGIAGEPVYLSDTAGLLQLAPGTYTSLVGRAVNTTSIQLTTPSASLAATYTTSVSFAASGTVVTDVTLGFRPKSGYIILNLGTTAITTNSAPLYFMVLLASGHFTESTVLWSYMARTYSPDATQAAPRYVVTNALSTTLVDATFAADDTTFALSVSMLDSATMRFTRTITKGASAADPGAQTLNVYFIPTS